ncbi:MAG: hypothetical protein HKN94_04425 [Acidimicrobiales bacterium]|nr:hypothetical protein [Acidimicrobiales bacterium]RZV45197.1 MAG: hypothetical protein EX269_10485 [Acidimicrobiales bacterium]
MNEDSEIETDGYLLATSLRRRTVALGLTALTALLIVWNLSPTPIRDPFQDAVGPIMRVSRMQQSWAYFAPEVGLVSTEAWVEIERSDGTVDRWNFTPDAPILQTLRTYRWQKYEEGLFFDERLWMPALEYVRDSGPDPASMVELRLIGAETAPSVGDHGPYDPAWTTTTLATLQVSGA